MAKGKRRMAAAAAVIKLSPRPKKKCSILFWALRLALRLIRFLLVFRYFSFVFFLCFVFYYVFCLALDFCRLVFKRNGMK